MNSNISEPRELLSRLENVRPERDGQWSARCPVHEDRRNSLSVGIASDGAVLLKCHAGCNTADVLRAVGLTLADLFPRSQQSGQRSNGKPRIVATYDYRDERGKLRFQVCRMEPKEFRQRKPGGNGGWTWTTKGIRKVLYGLPELLAADPLQPVFVVEGEKDVDRLRSTGLVATCNPGGAGKWKPAYGEALRGRHVVVIADNDDAGRKHAADVARGLRGIAASVRVVDLPNVPPKGDVSDWLGTDGTAGDLLTLVEGLPLWEPPTDESHENKIAASEHAKGELPLALLRPDQQTDLANARRFVKAHGDEVRFCHPWREWLIWDGARWKREVDGAPVRLAKSIADEIWATARDVDDGKLLKFAASVASRRAIDAMLALAQSDLPILPDEMDRDGWLLNCPNGTLDLRSGTLREHRREDSLTLLCPTRFNPKAKAPRWERFLKVVFAGDAELIRFVQRCLGYSLTGDVREQILLILWGVGANGKSTLLNAFLHALGTDYAMQAAPDLLITKRGDSHPTERADLFRKRFVSAVETEDGRKLAESLVKQLTGGERIRARRMRKDFFEFNPTHKLVLCTNHKPRVKGTDHAIWRRIRLIPFTQRFEADRQDKTLPDKLAAEAEGILAWAVRGCLDWQANGLGEPSAVKAATADYRNSQDAIAEFIGDCCSVGDLLWTRSGDLRAAYETWCKERGDRPAGGTTFAEGLVLCQSRILG